jgi:hypothetical protein
MIHYMLDAQIFVASGFPAHKKKALLVLHSSFRSGAYLTENRVYQKHTKLNLKLLFAWKLGCVSLDHILRRQMFN